MAAVVGAIKRWHYFAYGSNLSLPRLRERAPSCQVVTTALLAGHALRFHKRGRDGSGKCDACPTGNPADRVWGVVYSLLESERAALDAAEDLGRGYAALPVTVETGSGPLLVQTYIACTPMISPGLKPFDWYHCFVIEGARGHRLPQEYIAQLAQVVSVPDPDSDRAALNRRLITADGHRPAKGDRP